MTPAEVAEAFRVDPETVSRWAKKGKLPSIPTLGDHRPIHVGGEWSPQNQSFAMNLRGIMHAR
jgi:excisionase family DNA binding protein